MKTIKQIFGLLIMMMVMASFSQCSSVKNIQEKSPIALEQVYYQRWIGGVEGGGAGVNIFIPTKDNAVVLDSVYFRGQGTKLETKPQNGLLYIGRFISDFNKKKDMNFSSEPQGEYGNELPEITKKIPFELKNNECVISYLEGEITKYFKVENIVEKEMIPYPSAPPNKQ